MRDEEKNTPKDENLTEPPLEDPDLTQEEEASGEFEDSWRYEDPDGEEDAEASEDSWRYEDPDGEEGQEGSGEYDGTFEEEGQEGSGEYEGSDEEGEPGEFGEYEDSDDAAGEDGEVKKKSRWKSLPKFARVLIIVGGVILLLVLVAWIGIKMYLSRINRIEEKERLPRSQETFETSSGTDQDTISAEDIDWDLLYDTVKQDKDIKNIMLIGQDKRPGETNPARSDTMILCSINKKTNQITLISFMRDMYVPIPGYSDNRINASYNFGGAALLKETIEQDFLVGIDNAIEVDFEGFIQAMTSVGDLEIELSQDEADYLNEIGPVMNREAGLEDGVWNLKAGKNSLRPDQALAYSRTRHVGRSDWERTDRQRRVITAAFEKMLKLDLSEMLDVVNAVIPYFATDMTDSEILGYVYYIAKEGIHVKESLRIPADGAYTNERINNMAVLVPNLQKNRDLLKEKLYPN